MRGRMGAAHEQRADRGQAASICCIHSGYQTSQTRALHATATRERTRAQIDCMTSSGWREDDGSGVRREPRSTVVLSTHLLHPRQMTMRNVEHAAHRHVSGSCRERHAPECRMSRSASRLRSTVGRSTGTTRPSIFPSAASSFFGDELGPSRLGCVATNLSEKVRGLWSRNHARPLVLLVPDGRHPAPLL